jgi:hypothetical protein
MRKYVWVIDRLFIVVNCVRGIGDANLMLI